MKYCIGCCLLNFFPGEEGQVYSEYTSDPSTPAQFACAKKHWAEQLEGSTNVVDIERAMAKAETCPDYWERSDPTSSSNYSPDKEGKTK